MGLAALASYTACLYFGNPDWLPDDGIDRDFWPFYLPHLRAWQILMGVLVAIATTRSTRKTRAIQRGFARLVWLVAAVGIGLAVSVREPTSEGINSADYRIRTLATIACTATAALLLVGPHCAWRPHPIVTRLCDRVGRVGDRSYALYLVHWPVVLLQGQLRPMLPAAWLLNLAVTALLAEALHVVVERRVLRLSIAPRRVLALFFAGQSLLTGTIWWYRSIALDRAAHQPSQEVFFNETADCGQLVMPFRCAVRRSEMAIFVEGDSHSQMVFPELLEIAARRNLSVEANMQMGGYDFEYFSTDVLTTAAQVVVVIWFHHAQDPSNIEGRVLRHLDRSNVVRILVVLDTPSMASWHLATIPRPAAEAQRSPLLVERMTELARRDDRVRLIEPLDAFCEGDQCPVRDGDDIFYSDEHHLSWAGAARIADWLDRQIAAAFE